MSCNQPVIIIDNVSKKYSKGKVAFRSLREDIMRVFSKPHQKEGLQSNEFFALKGISLTINSGESIGLVGANGAGKSTLFKLIANVTYPTKGNITVTGKVAPLLELGAGFHPDLSGHENIFVNGVILGMSIRLIKQKIASIIEFAEIGEFINMPIKYYSSGMFLRLAFSVAVHSDADIYLFDEVITVGDQDFQKKCFKKLAELKELKKTMLFVSHNQEVLERVVDKILFIKDGICTHQQEVKK